ncbi:hypothetical protein G6682_03660 [Polynucleobacter paneuropaeus]|jgi:hypothetical protein|nr:hypothetical protein G6682_03660 [Polynucleobacter paneuropaeus]
MNHDQVEVDNPNTSQNKFPEGLLDWAGHRSGGVKKMFYASSGRPAGVIFTELLRMIDRWAASLSIDMNGAPRIILLIGGPGNGKTEAVEYALRCLDKHFGFDEKLLLEVSKMYTGLGDKPSPRMVEIECSKFLVGKSLSIKLVQDASATDSGSLNHSAAESLINDLEATKNMPLNAIYIACINRGVLDDAQIIALDHKKEYTQRILELAIKAASLMPDSPECWPLNQYPNIGVWPMDAESLVSRSDLEMLSPLEQILDIALSDSRWSEYKSCGAGVYCPFCSSKKRLETSDYQRSLIKYFRWYEIASGKRWSFRDVFSLTAFLLAGVSEIAGDSGDPCNIAKNLVAAIDNPLPKKNKNAAALFYLVSMQYHQALFLRGNQYDLKQLKIDVNDVKLHDVSAQQNLDGFLSFLSNSYVERIPSTLDLQLVKICEILDPALADSDFMVDLSSKTRVPYREVDMRFSQSVGEGLRYLQQYQCLSVIEIELLKRLAILDYKLTNQEYLSKRPTSAERILNNIRVFSCAIARRSIAARSCTSNDYELLSNFEKVIDGDNELLHLSAKEFEKLLNAGKFGDKFEVQLNSTFGEPAPQPERRALLTTVKQRVRLVEILPKHSPKNPIQFLRVGNSGLENLIPLTFDLFKSIHELRNGMMQSSLPRSVVALLDITRAKLAGAIVRNDEDLEGAEIKIGVGNDTIVREMDRFIVTRSGGAV